MKNEFKQLASRIRALDNEVKLSIIVLLTKRGALSITDISKELKINFSTTHKYLEQLEKAGLLKSNTVLKNRLKRLFYVNDFNIEISPKKLVEGDKTPESANGDIRVLTRTGKMKFFDVNKLMNRYLPHGLPLATIEQGAELVKKRVYDGITSLELEAIFKKFLEDKINSLNNAIQSLAQLKPKDRTYSDILQLLHPEALKMHMQGNIFIQNLSEPKLLNFIHDIRGISIHGIDNKAPSNLSDLFNQLLNILETMKDITNPVHCFDSFNYFIAPLASRMKDEELNAVLEKFLVALDKLNISAYFGLDLGQPNFLKIVPTTYYVRTLKPEKTYEHFIPVAEKILQQILKFRRDKKLENINCIIKVWDSKKVNGTISNKDYPLYFANMTLPWQQITSSYVGLTRFDSNWNSWFRVIRTGEVQRITVNLPRIALDSKNEKDFFIRLESILKSCIHAFGVMTELIAGDTYRRTKIIFRSVQREKWNYLPVEDGLYSIRFFGLSEAIFFLNNGSIKNNLSLADKTLKFSNEVIQKHGGNIRIALGEQHDPEIIKRFEYIDTLNYSKEVSYSGGIHEKDSIFPELYQYLRGGHINIVSKDKFDLKHMFDNKLPYVFVN